MKLSSDFRELLLKFNAETVEYILIGAYALAAHGMPRYTGDIDIFYRPEEENVKRVLQALYDFGFKSPELNIESLMEPDSVFYFGRPPFRIDLLNSISGVSFETAWRSAVPYVLDGIPLPVLSLEDLARNKKATGRLKDIADLELIEKRLASGQ